MKKYPAHAADWLARLRFRTDAQEKKNLIPAALLIEETVRQVQALEKTVGQSAGCRES